MNDDENKRVPVTVHTELDDESLVAFVMWARLNPLDVVTNPETASRVLLAYSTDGRRIQETQP